MGGGRSGEWLREVECTALQQHLPGRLCRAARVFRVVDAVISCRYLPMLIEKVHSYEP